MDREWSGLELEFLEGTQGVVVVWQIATILRHAPNLPHCQGGDFGGIFRGFLGQKSIFCPRIPPVDIYIWSSTNIMTFELGQSSIDHHCPAHHQLGLVVCAIVLFDCTFEAQGRGRGGAGDILSQQIKVGGCSSRAVAWTPRQHPKYPPENSS